MKITSTNLVKKYKGRAVVDDVSFDISTGEIVGLLGPNGAGKTTTFYMVTGLVKPDQGTVLFDEKEITAWPMHIRARSGIGYLAQETSVFRRISVQDNIKLVLELQKQSKKQIQDKIDELAEELHITQILDRTAGVLSGGERRRVEIARALASNPRMLIFDDAMSGLDEDAEAVIQQNMVHIAQGRTLFVMAHRLSAVRQAHCVYVVERGEIVEQGTHDELLRAGGSYTRLHAYQAGSER